MKNIPLVVGNRVTYKFCGCENTILITDSDEIKMLKDLEIIKVEACLWEEIEFVEEVNDYDEMLEDYKRQKEIEKLEEKELLTEEEKSFLKQYIKFSNVIITGIKKDDSILNFMQYDNEELYILLNDSFEGLENHKHYRLIELGLED